MSKEIQVELGGSGHGISYYCSALECPKRTAFDYDFDLDKGPKPHEIKSKATLIGTFLHAFMESYYKQELPQAANLDEYPFRFSQITVDRDTDFIQSCRMEAERLFRSYRTHKLAAYEPKELGKVLSVEEFFDLTDVETPWKPKGIPLTARMDLVVKLTQKDCDRILKTRNVKLSPGIWVVDHKTEAFNTSPVVYVTSPQFVAYPLIYEAKHDKEVQGSLVNVVTKDTVPKFKTIKIPKRPDSVKFMTHLLALGHEMAKSKVANPIACKAFGGCKHFNNACRGY